MDLVVNYIFDEYVWFVEVWENFNSFECDFYFWWDEFNDLIFIFSGLVWEYDKVLG